MSTRGFVSAFRILPLQSNHHVSLVRKAKLVRMLALRFGGHLTDRMQVKRPPKKKKKKKKKRSKTPPFLPTAFQIPHSQIQITQLCELYSTSSRGDLQHIPADLLLFPSLKFLQTTQQ
jgi:hypothetical protein